MFVLYLVDLASVCDLNQSCSIFLYADDILLIAPTVSKLEAVVYYIFASVSCSGLIWISRVCTVVHYAVLEAIRVVYGIWQIWPLCK